MARIHRITHDHALTRRKVNFFADYFAFAAEGAGVYDSIEIDNALSATDKIIFQIANNPNRCSSFIDSYLTHETFGEYEALEKNKAYKKIQALVSQYKGNKKPAQKVKWIHSRPDFLNALKIYRRELKRLMFKQALNSVISYLRCVHEIDEHKADLIRQTHTIISEFILNDRSKRDIATIFERILTKEIGAFPFPTSLKSDQEKENFIKNRTFQQQFDGIYNVLKEKLTSNHFLFRVYGLKTHETFEFTYNKVTFYSPKHNHLNTVVTKITEQKHNSNFLEDSEFLMIASIKAEYGSIDTAVSLAVETIVTELKFVNKVFNSNCTLEKFSYLVTSDFTDLGYHRSVKDKGSRMGDNEAHLLEDNPYKFLKKAKKSLKETLLRNELIYVDALTNRNVATYWQYLETIIPSDQKDEKQIIGIVSHLLLLNAESHEKRMRRSYVFDAISPLNTAAEDLGITNDRQIGLFNSKPNTIDWLALSREINHPFISHLIAELLTPVSKEELLRRRSHYQRVLWDAQAQRNALIHRGLANEKALVSLGATLPRLVTRLRWTLFNGIKEGADPDYTAMVHRLKERAITMIT